MLLFLVMVNGCTIIRLFFVSIGEVCNCRQKPGCDWVVSNWLARTSIGEVRNCRQNQGAMGGAKIARSHIDR